MTNKTWLSILGAVLLVSAAQIEEGLAVLDQALGAVFSTNIGGGADGGGRP